MKNTDLSQDKKKKELGASLVEYGLLVALIAVIAIPSVKAVSTGVNTNVTKVNLTLGASNLNPLED